MADEAPRYTAQSLIAATPEGTQTGERFHELAVTGAYVAMVPPYGRAQVASFARTLLNREPILSGPMYEAHRLILGALVLDLEGDAVADALDDAYRPPEFIDIRDPGAVAREAAVVQGTREWALSHQERAATAYHAHVDVILAESERAHGQAEAALLAAVASAQRTLEPPAPEVFGGEI